MSGIAVNAGSSKKPALYRSEQASAGRKLYDANCSACHGERLEGGAGPALSGSALATLARNTRLTVGDMFAWASLQMPLNEPASLKRAEYVDIMAYILQVNGYPAGPTALNYAIGSRSNVKMSAR